jgi:phospholipase C
VLAFYRWPARAAALLVCIATAACAASPQGAALPPDLRAVVQHQPQSKIRHVVIVVQENRSFDDLFLGYPGADTQNYGYTKSGRKLSLRPVGLSTGWDIGHDSQNEVMACDGTGKLPGTQCRMDGFNEEYLSCGAPHTPMPCPHRNPQYGYVPRDQIKPYWELAHRYVLADRTFPSNFDGSSFISHQYAIAAQADAAIDYPAGEWGCDGGPNDTIGTIDAQRQPADRVRACFRYRTLADELDDAGLDWTYYATRLTASGGIWSAFQAVRHIRYGPDWKAHVVHPPQRFFKDVKNGRLGAVSWITPTCENSDHAGCNASGGPDWVASIVNAVGESAYWKSTAIFVFWDDYGGWYDHVPPPHADYDGLGMRVPLLVVSAYAKRGHVSHVRYETGSLLRFAEDEFGLGRLSASDARANSPAADCFDFTQPPRAFTPIQTTLHARDFERQPPDGRVPDAQ